MNLQFLTWDRAAPSGGNTYNTELCAAVGEEGVAVRLRRLPGAWPTPTSADRRRLADALAEHPRSLVDGILAAGCPDELAAAARAGRRVAVLFHSGVADELHLEDAVAQQRSQVEAAALRAAWRVICPSRHAAARLRARRVANVRVAAPGGRREVRAVGSEPPQLLCLAALSATKNQLVVVSALAELAHLPWQATLAGPTDLDPNYATRVAEAIRATDLTRRIRLPGTLTGVALAQQWYRSDLLLLPSRRETFGLVVTEALARGIPAIVSDTTGAAETLKTASRSGEGGAALPGARVPATDAAAWRDLLERWLTDAQLRREWRGAALTARQWLRSWRDTAREVLIHLD